MIRIYSDYSIVAKLPFPLRYAATLICVQFSVNVSRVKMRLLNRHEHPRAIAIRKSSSLFLQQIVQIVAFELYYSVSVFVHSQTGKLTEHIMPDDEVCRIREDDEEKFKAKTDEFEYMVTGKATQGDIAAAKAFFEKMVLIENPEEFVARAPNITESIDKLETQETKLGGYCNAVKHHLYDANEHLKEVLVNIHVLIFVKEQEESFVIYCNLRENILMHSFVKPATSSTYFHGTDGIFKYEKGKEAEVLKMLQEEPAVCTAAVQRIEKMLEKVESKFNISASNLVNVYNTAKKKGLMQPIEFLEMKAEVEIKNQEKLKDKAVKRQNLLLNSSLAKNQT